MSTLKHLVDETTNIKNELISCHTNLKNILIEKGFECSDYEKFPTLIDKISDSIIINSIGCGDSFVLFHDNNSYGITGRPNINTNMITSYTHNYMNGGIRVSVDVYGSTPAGSIYATTTARIELQRDGAVILSKSGSAKGNSVGATTKLVLDVDEIHKNDKICIYGTGDTNYTHRISNFKISCNVLL